MIETTLRFTGIFVYGIAIGAWLLIILAPIATSKFYSELAKKSIKIIRVVCKEAKQTKIYMKNMIQKAI